MERKLIRILENDYIVKFPNVGNIMDIEAMKFSLAKGKYLEMCLSPLKVHNFTLDTIDSISTFAVLIPELKEDLNINDWREMSPLTAKKLMQAYISEFWPWYKPIIEDLYEYAKNDSEQQEEE